MQVWRHIDVYSMIGHAINYKVFFTFGAIQEDPDRHQADGSCRSYEYMPYLVSTCAEHPPENRCKHDAANWVNPKEWVVKTFPPLSKKNDCND